MPHFIEYIWKNSKYEKSNSDADENEEMECIEFLSLRDIKSDDEYDETRNDEEYLKEIHEKREIRDRKNKKNTV